jgi:hypothetical protein
MAPHFLARAATGIKAWAKNQVPTKTGIRNFFVGDPRRFAEEVVSGKALGKHGLIRDSLRAPGLLNKAMFYGLPAYEGVNIARDNEPDKAKRIGALAGATTLGLAAFRPLGLLGSIGASYAGDRLGGGIGQTADYLVRGNKTPQL